MLSPYGYAKNPKKEDKEHPSCLSHGFYLQLNSFKADVLNKTRKGLTPSEYEQCTHILTGYTAAQAAIKKLTS